jgi:RNA polymerase sigma-70 factor (ECF subfamily)
VNPELPTPLEYLVRACADSNNGAAWDEFVARLHRPISLSVLRTAWLWGSAPQSVVEELVQETYLKLCANRCKLLLEFANRHPEAIAGYIKTVAVNVTHDYFKSRHSRKRGAGNADHPMEEAANSIRREKKTDQQEIEQQVLLRQVDQCLDACSQGPDQQRDRTVFWLYYRQGMTAKDIASMPAIGLSAKGVESLLFRLTCLVRKRLAGKALESGSG